MGTIYRNGFYYGGEKKEVIECNELPETGMSEVLYIKDDCLFYWNGTEFVEISNSDPGMSFDVEKNEIAIGGNDNSLIGSKISISNLNKGLNKDFLINIDFSEAVDEVTFSGNIQLINIDTNEIIETIDLNQLNQNFSFNHEITENCKIKLIGETNRIWLNKSEWSIKEYFKESRCILHNNDYTIKEKLLFTYKNLESARHPTLNKTIYQLTGVLNCEIILDKNVTFISNTNNTDRLNIVTKNASLSLCDNNLTALDGNTRFTMHDSAIMDLTGGENRPDAGPKLWMHGNAHIMTHDGWYMVDTNEEDRPYYSIKVTFQYNSPISNPETYNPSVSALIENSDNDIAFYYKEGESWHMEVPGHDRPALAVKIFKNTEGYTLKEKQFNKNSTKTKDGKTYYLYTYTYKYVANSNGLYPSINLQALGYNVKSTSKTVPSVSIMESAHAYLGGKSDISTFDNAHLYMSGSSDVNIYNSIVHFNKSKYGPLGNYEGTDSILEFSGANIQVVGSGDRTNPIVRLHEGTHFQMGGLSEGSFYTDRSGNKQKNKCGSDYSNLEVYGSADVYADGHSSIKIHDSSAIEMNGISTIETSDESYLRMTGSSKIVLQDQQRYGTNSPTIFGNPTEFTIAAMGRGMWGDTSIGEQRYGPWEEVNNNDVSGYTFRISGDTRTTLGLTDFWGNPIGKTYINIASKNDTDNLNINIHGSSFINTTGNSHIEAHDDSTFIMRGIVPLKENGEQKPAWSDGVAGWIRPIATRENGPGVGYYDKSTFIMRGKWNTEETITQNTSSFTVYDLESFPENPNDFTEEMMDKYKQALIKNKQYYIDGGTVTYSDKGSGEYLVTVTNANVTDKPTGWDAHPVKIEEQPLVEIIEDAEVRITGNSELKLNDFSICAGADGITFSDGSDSVTFTIAELKALKNGGGSSINVLSQQEWEGIINPDPTTTYVILAEEGNPTFPELDEVTIPQGGAYEAEFTFQNEDGSEVDLTDKTVHYLLSKQGEEDSNKLSAEMNNEDGNWKLTLTTEQTANLEVGTYTAKIVVKDIEGNQFKYVRGIVNIISDTTSLEVDEVGD